MTDPGMLQTLAARAALAGRENLHSLATLAADCNVVDLDAARERLRRMPRP